MASPGDADRLPTLESLRCLEDQVHAGYIRGVHQALDQIEQAEPGCTAFVARLREMARLFQLDALAHQVESALARAATERS
ncbi:MAG: hypothetical protein I8H76_08805 [Burkholderiales bacterium]|nr:hypothetical protein [Burkholderiales bacterium]